MKTKEFIDFLLEELGEFDVVATEATELRSLEFWDSMSSLILISAVDKKFNTKLTRDQINSFNTFKDIIDEIGRSRFE